jgi:hypothetical protein
MLANGTLPSWAKSERIKGVAAAAALLFAANGLIGQILLRLDVQATQTFLDDIAMASLGGLIVWFLLDWQANRQEMVRAHERALLTVKLNNQVRGAVSTMASAILFREQDDRLRVVDEAIQQIDRVLTDLTQTMVTSSSHPRMQ